MKLHEYNEMMSYVLRRRPMSMGGRVGFARGDFITKEGYGKGVKGSNIPLSEYEKEYKGITKYYNKTRSGKWSSLTPQQRNNFIKTFERNILKPRGLLKELKADPEKLKKFKEDVANNSRIEVKEMYGTKGKPLSESVLARILRQFGITKFGKSGRERAAILKVKPEVTKNANKILNILKKNPKISTNDLFLKSNLKKNDFFGAVQALKVDKSYAGKKRFNIPENLKDRIKGISVTTTVEETLTEKKVLKPEEIKKSFTDPRKAISKFFDKGTVFEHTFPRTLIPFIKGEKNQKALEITGTRTSPFLNIFKRRYDNLQRGAVSKFLKDGDLKSYNKTINNIRDTIKKATGGYETGYIKFDKNKKATPVVNATPVTEGFKQFGVETNQRMSAFKNAKYSSNLLRNYLKNPDSEIFNSLRTEFPPERISKDLIKNLDTAAKSYDKAEPFLGNIKKFTNFAQKNIENPLVKALFKTSYGKAALVTGAVLSPSLLAADEPGAETPDDFPTGKVAAGAAAAPLATKKGRSIYGKAAKQIARGVGKTLAVGALPLEAGFVLSDLKSGASTPEALANILLLGGAVRQKEKKDFISNKYGPEVYAQIQSYKSFDEDGMDIPQELPEQFQAIELEADQFVEDERTRRAEEFARQTEEDRSLPLIPESMTEGLYALGGRVGFAKGPKDPSRRKFIKVMGGLASLPIIGKYFKLAEPISKAAPAVSEGVKLGADKLMMLVEKIKLLGKSADDLATQERQKVTKYEGKDGSEYELVEDLTTGDISVTRDKPGVAVYGRGTDDVEGIDVIEDRSTFTIRRGEEGIKDEGLETQKSFKEPDEYEEGRAVFDQDGTVADIDDVDDEVIKAIEDEIK